MQLLLVLFLQIVLTFQSNLNNENFKISNGEEAIPLSIPYQVLIKFRPVFNPLDIKDDWNCGGILISSRYVLTTARCVESAYIISPIVGIDSWLNWRDGEFFNLYNNSVIVHENYDKRTYENNLALIEVPGFNLTEKISAAPLPSYNEVDMDLVGLEAKMSGYSSQNIDTETLWQVNNTVISNSECSEFDAYITDSELCISGADKKRACIKDEGGPVAIGDIVQGIISFRNETCVSTLPTVAIRISSYLEWIEKNSDWKP